VTDRELLELASKAARFELYDHTILDDGVWLYTPGSHIDAEGKRPIFLWDPLGDDGDALRLAVQLGLDLKLSQYLPEAFDLVPGATPLQIDAFEKVRRAIVEAAAEIGRAMP
jgi:hypothetical protein